MAKKSNKRRGARKSTRRGLSSVTCSRVKGKTVCKPTLSGVKRRKTSKGKRRGGLAGAKRKTVKGNLRGLGEVTCQRGQYGYNCRKV